MGGGGGATFSDCFAFFQKERGVQERKREVTNIVLFVKMAENLSNFSFGKTRRPVLGTHRLLWFYSVIIDMYVYFLILKCTFRFLRKISFK